LLHLLKVGPAVAPMVEGENSWRDKRRSNYKRIRSRGFRVVISPRKNHALPLTDSPAIFAAIFASPEPKTPAH
jgi:hypothetical protein